MMQIRLSELRKIIREEMEHGDNGALNEGLFASDADFSRMQDAHEQLKNTIDKLGSRLPNVSKSFEEFDNKLAAAWGDKTNLPLLGGPAKLTKKAMLVIAMFKQFARVWPKIQKTHAKFIERLKSEDEVVVEKSKEMLKTILGKQLGAGFWSKVGRGLGIDKVTYPDGLDPDTLISDVIDGLAAPAKASENQKSDENKPKNESLAYRKNLRLLSEDLAMINALVADLSGLSMPPPGTGGEGSKGGPGGEGSKGGPSGESSKGGAGGQAEINPLQAAARAAKLDNEFITKIRPRYMANVLEDPAVLNAISTKIGAVLHDELGYEFRLNKRQIATIAREMAKKISEKYGA